MKDFTIDKASWQTQRPRNYEFDNTIVYKYFRSIIDYMAAKGLLNNPILAADQEVTDDTRIMASDLTEEGLVFVKAVYDKWIGKVVDGKISPDDYKLLDKALKKIRESQ
ncbi:hypothetical protein [[Flexibacter] sp. ATCC 35208]|uniref:hypothetical protein n=1 Tax=[Flexibacter] sp. ATCC 35208 TaxID=1936242 RepID=UPI0009D2579D|nr:hypothetical protein [[Flexibacter] sp. ATCC 35208]OMP80020.1 hypothetical protein BW716_05875 [[Flexibacter] sp. ATCC 35208]